MFGSGEFLLEVQYGGEGGIRTLVGVNSPSDFESAPL